MSSNGNGAPPKPGERENLRVQRLIALRAETQQTNYEKIRQALIALDKERVPITVAGVARKAQLSRQTVYNSPFIGEIKEAVQKTSVAQRSEMRAQMTAKSKDHRYREVMEQNRKLREKIKELEKQIDVLLLQMRSK